MSNLGNVGRVPFQLFSSKFWTYDIIILLSRVPAFTEKHHTFTLSQGHSKILFILVTQTTSTSDICIFVFSQHPSRPRVRDPRLTVQCHHLRTTTYCWDDNLYMNFPWIFGVLKSCWQLKVDLCWSLFTKALTRSKIIWKTCWLVWYQICWDFFTQHR